MRWSQPLDVHIASKDTTQVPKGRISNCPKGPGGALSIFVSEVYAVETGSKKHNKITNHIPKSFNKNNQKGPQKCQKRCPRYLWETQGPGERFFMIPEPCGLLPSTRTCLSHAGNIRVLAGLCLARALPARRSRLRRSAVFRRSGGAALRAAMGRLRRPMALFYRALNQESEVTPIWRNLRLGRQMSPVAYSEHTYFDVSAT